MSTCGRCGGHGRITAFGHVHGGLCFACDGTGISDTPAESPTPMRTCAQLAAVDAERTAREAAWAATPIGTIVARNSDLPHCADLLDAARNGHEDEQWFHEHVAALPGVLFSDDRLADATLARDTLHPAAH